MSALRNAFEEMLRAEADEEIMIKKQANQEAVPGPASALSHPLREAFEAAILQATKGKGERHGGDATPFFDQPWYSIAKQVGVGGLVFQMMKKAGEACGKPDQESFERELLGAIVYAGMAYLYVKKHGFKPENKV